MKIFCRVALRAVFASIFLFVFVFNSIGQNTTFKAGSAIIDMGGAGAPTVANSLKPYGLIYALLSGYNVPVNGIIGQSKVKDGIDFTYGSKSYKGGSYIIAAEFISPDVKSLLNSWATQGVIIDYTTSDLTVNVTYKISFAPKWVMDKTNGSIAVAYLTAAGIPASSYSFKDPSQLGDCDDIFVLPHASPSWNTHNNLYFFNKNKGSIYVSCSAGSALEALYKDTVIGGVSQRIQMNFLTTTGLVPASTHKAAVTPFVHQFPTDPIAQYMGITDGAQLKGAEVVYLPKKGGIWNPNSKIITKSPTQPDIPTLSDGPAAINVYGRGFDDPTRGYVFYEAAHSVSGTTSDFIAAQRMFFNFSFFALGEKSKSSFTVTLNNNANPAVSTVPSQMRGTIVTAGLTATVSLPGTYKYEWKSSVPGTFSPSATISSTTLTATTVSFTPNDVNSTTQAVITCVVTDANCSRSAFDSKGTAVAPSTPTLNTAALTFSAKSDCANNTISFNVLDSVVDVNAVARTLSITTSPSNGSITVNGATGFVTYTPNALFQGTETLNYTISNAGSTPASNTITINVGNYSLAPSLTNDTYTNILEDQLTTLKVLDNDKNNPSSTSNTKLYIRDITVKPAKGYIYINNDGTLSYLTKANIASSNYTETFSYQACNDLNYCSIATVTVSVVDCGCASGTYKTGISTSSSNGTVTLTATADAYLDANNNTTKYGTSDNIYVNGFYSSSRYYSTDKRNKPILLFDISSLKNLTINSATLRLYLKDAISSSDLSSSNNPFPATVYGLKNSWDESTVSWNYRNYTSKSNKNSWSSGGAEGTSDYNSTPTGVLTLSNGVAMTIGSYLESNITNIVSGWYSGTSNYGLIIKPTSTSSSGLVNFYSKNSIDKAPVLIVSYTTIGNTIPCTNIPTTYKPIAYLDKVTTASNANLTISPLSNDANYYGHTNTITRVGTPAHGSATISGTNILYVPSGSFVGVDTLYYTVTDATNSTTSTATIRIDVTRVAPKINHDEATTPSATTILVNVAANDTDPQGTIDVPVITVNPKFGTAIISGNSISYTPNVGYVGNDTLIYSRASSPVAGSCSMPLSDTALVVITMTNRVPTAANDNFNATSCKPIEMDLLVNDADPEGTPLTIFIVANPTHGTISVDELGKYKYTSATNYVGSDQFTYYVKDGGSPALSSSTATVSINVAAASINHPPIAADDSDNTVVNQDVSTDVIANDSDPDNDAISINITAAGLQLPAHGTIQLLGNGQINYMPDANYTGTDSYQYQVCDNNINCTGVSGNLCAFGTVTITVKAVPISISGTVWNDIDKSANNTFTNIQNGTEKGSNAFNALYAHLVDANNNVIDQAPIAYDGTYLFTNAPSNATNLKIVINSQLFALGSIDATGTIPTGFAATTPSITNTFSTTTTNIIGQDFGINQLPTANSFTFAEQTNPSPSSLTVNASKFSGSDPDGTVASFKFTSFPTNVSSITINSVTYTSTSWPVNGVTVGVAGLAVSVVPLSGTVSPTIKYVTIDNTGFAAATEANIILPLYIQLSAGTISLNAGTSSTTISYCGPSVPGQMYSLTNPAGGRGTILYQWEKSTDGTTWSDKVGATLVSYSPTLAVDVTTYYRRRSYTSIDNAVYSNTITVTINTLPTITNSIAGSRTGSGSVDINATPSSGATIDWYSNLTGGTSISSANYTYTTPSISTSTLYYAQARDLTTSCLSAIRTPVLAEVVGTLNAGVIGADQAQCGPAIPDLLESVVDATAGSTISYQWQSSTNGITYTDITSATDLTYQANTINSTTYYRRIATATISGTSTSTSSNVVTITVNPIPALPIAVNKARTGVGTVILSATTPTGITVDWYDDNVMTNTLATGSNNFTTPQLADTTSYFAVARNISTGCYTGTTEVIAIVNEEMNGGAIDGPSSICYNGIPTIINSISLAKGGTPDLTGATLGTYSYQWESSTTSTSAGFTVISGAVSLTYQPGTLTNTTFYRRKVTTPNDPAVYSNVLTINVNPLPTVATIANASICAGTGIILTTTGASTYSWTPNNGLSSTNIASPTASPSSTSTYTVTGIDVNGCSNTSSTTITVNAVPSITLGTLSSVNSNATSFNLPYTATTGSPNTYSISVTTPNALSGFTAISNNVLTSSPISISIPTSAAGTYNFNINVSNSTTGCTSPNLGFSQTITQVPSVGLSYTSPNVYTKGSAITVLSPTITGGTLTGYSILPALPAGLTIDATTGEISGTSTVISSATNYTVTANSSIGSVTAVLNITVNDIAPSGLSYTTPHIYTKGIAISALNPTISGGAVTGYTISPALPLGLTIDASTGVISGTATVISVVTDYTVTASNSGGSVTAILNISVKDVAPSGLIYSTPNIYRTGVTITNLNPTVTGDVTSYTINPALPSGLSINGTTGIISGTPNAATSIATYVVTASNSGGSVSANIIITVLNNTVVQPQGGILAVDYKLLSSDTVKIKANITAGLSPYTLIIKNSLNSKIDTITNVLNGDIIKFNPVSNDVTYTISKIIDANSVARSSSFTKDTTFINILLPNIALTLKAGTAVKRPDNSFTTTLSLKIQNSGEINLANVQVNANLSNVFPAGIKYKLDSIKVVSGNVVINPSYSGSGSATTPFSIAPGIGFKAGSGIKTNALLDANYLFSNGVNLAINEQAQIVYYLSIDPTTENIVLKLQFNSSGDAQITKADGTISQQIKQALSKDGTNLASHPNNSNAGIAEPTYLPLFPVEKIGASLLVGSATPVTGGYNFPFVLKIKNYGNLNLDSVSILQSFVSTFKSPDSASLVGLPTFTGNIILNPAFNGYTDTLLVNENGSLIPGDSATISYTLFVATNKTSATWLNQFIAKGHSSLDYIIVADSSMDGSNPDPNFDGDPIEFGMTRFSINYIAPLPPTVNNATYVYNTSIPASIGGLVKSYPIGTIPVWCNVNTAICQTNAPATPTLIGKYVYLLKSYDTTSKLYSIQSVNDTITIKPPVPIVADSTYLLNYTLNPLDISPLVKGLTNSSLVYYIKTIKQNAVPLLSHNIGTIRYAVSQIVNQLESDTASFNVTIIDPSSVIHLRKIMDTAVIQSNSTYNYAVTFVASNLTKYPLSNLVITDNLQNSIPLSCDYIVSNNQANGGLVANNGYNGNVDFNVTSNASTLKGFAKDTAKFTLNITPKGYSGTLSNQAFVKVNTIWGTVAIPSSDETKENEKSKQPTNYTIKDLKIYIPEGFSPNYDGVHDNFVIIKPFGVTLDLQVFNRWGNIVYTNSNYQNDWDGRGTGNFAGKDLVDGGYYYTLRAVDGNGKVEIFKGSIIIQR